MLIKERTHLKKVCLLAASIEYIHVCGLIIVVSFTKCLMSHSQEIETLCATYKERTATNVNLKRIKVISPTRIRFWQILSLFLAFIC